MEDKEKVIVALTKEDLDKMMANAALVGATVATDKMTVAFEKKQKEQKDRRLHNTKLLLKNYRMLKSSCRNAVFEGERVASVSELMEEIMSMKDDHVIVESIRRSAIRTETILKHVDTMLDVYRLYCNKQGDREKRQYKVIRAYYISNEKNTIQTLAKEFSVSKVTIYDDLKIGEERLSALLFGVDGLKFFA